MNKYVDSNSEENKKNHFSTDHLKNREYVLNITLSNKVIKTLKLKK